MCWCLWPGQISSGTVGTHGPVNGGSRDVFGLLLPVTFSEPKHVAPHVPHLRESWRAITRTGIPRLRDPQCVLSFFYSLFFNRSLLLLPLLQLLHLCYSFSYRYNSRMYMGHFMRNWHGFHPRILFLHRAMISWFFFKCENTFIKAFKWKMSWKSVSVV